MSKRSYRVLVVEDEPHWQQTYRHLLQRRGYEVETASTKEEARAKLQQGQFDAYLLDLRLDDADPKNADGIEILTWLDGWGQAGRAIIRSAYVTDELRKRILALAPLAILEKESLKDIPDLIAIAVQIDGSSSSEIH